MSKTHPILDKKNSVNYVKKQFQTEKGIVSVMAYADGYFMLLSVIFCLNKYQITMNPTPQQLAEKPTGLNFNRNTIAKY